ncbi:MAG: trypsin-like serine protease [bacterium]|nr:trypsin-like serine protease [bacterium]
MLAKQNRTVDLRLAIATLIFLTTLIPLDSLAVVIRHDKDDADVLRLGQRFDAVGRVLPDGACTLVAPTWIATAAHVAASITADSRIQFGNTKYAVKRTVIHPEGGKRRGRPPEVDLALVELADSVKSIKPIELYKERKELGATLFIVGYGDYGSPKSGLKRTDHRRRAVTNVVDDAGPLRIFMTFHEPPEGTEHEGVGGPGDSGGPALLEQDGKLYLVGVSSGSMNGKPGQYGVTDVYTRVSSYIEWITKVMNSEPQS